MKDLQDRRRTTQDMHFDFSFFRSDPHEHKNPASRLGFSLNGGICNKSRDQIHNRSTSLHGSAFCNPFSLPMNGLLLRGLGIGYLRVIMVHQHLVHLPGQ